ncbi:MAG: PhoH family protein [Enterobacterales bacterium]|nr:PhoH family protein [Enterobacterales bacterium]
MNAVRTRDFKVDPIDNIRMQYLCGEFDDHLRQIERRLGVEISNRGQSFSIIGSERMSEIAEKILANLYRQTEGRREIHAADVHLQIQMDLASTDDDDNKTMQEIIINTKRGTIKPKGASQSLYLQQIMDYDVSFGIGPAGTGKTYLAVAAAVDALERQQVRRIILTRPAVEAGERLGFLPGDLAQKIDPYLRPLYDALYEMLGFETIAKLVERNVIEVAPLAYMRGRTLNDSFIILDESQNTSIEQMKMFLTRIGFRSKVVITGDITQIDLPRGTMSGLRHVIEVLKDVEQISFTFFASKDVVRHSVVQRIVEAYESHESTERS